MYMGILTEKSYFCALSVTFLRLVCILKLEDLLQDYVKWKNTMTFNVRHKMSGRGLVISNVEIDRKIIFLCPLRYIFEAKVCILKLEGLLQAYVKWKNTMTGYVNFLTQNVGSETSVYGDIDRKIIFLCPLRYIFEAGVHFKVGRSSSSLC